MIEGEQHVGDRRAVGHVGVSFNVSLQNGSSGQPYSHETADLSTLRSREPSAAGAESSEFSGETDTASPGAIARFRAVKPGSDSTGISASRRLKWFNSLYRPAVPEGIRGKLLPPLSRPAIGASPSGKAVDFDSTMRRFESSRPSQAVGSPGCYFPVRESPRHSRGLGWHAPVSGR